MTPLSPRLARIAPGILFAALVAVVWADPLWTGRTFTGRDLLAYNLPMEKTIHDAYASGTMPVWNPWISGGRPLLPNPNSGALYPPRVALAALPFALAMRLFPLLHWTAAGIGVLVLLRSLGLKRGAAWVGAATYAFSGVAISEVFYPHIQAGFALLPWIAWAAARRRAAGSRGTLLLAALFGLDFLAADVFTGALAVGVALLWIAAEETARAAGPAALAVGAAALGAPRGAPDRRDGALDPRDESRRARDEAVGGDLLLRFAAAARGASRSVSLRADLAPRARLDLVLEGVQRQGDRPLLDALRRGARAARAVPALEGAAFRARVRAMARRGRLAVAVLPSLLPRAWLGAASPLPLRNPEKLVIAAVLGFAVFAGYGVEEFARRTPRRSVSLGVGALLAALAALCALAPLRAGIAAADLFDGGPRRAARAADHLPGALAEAGLLWMATVVALEGLSGKSRGATVLSLAALTLVPIVPDSRIPEISAPEEAFAPTAFALRVQRSDPAGSFRVLGESVYRAATAAERQGEHSALAIVELPRRDWIQHTQALWHRGTVFNTDFDSGDLSRVESLRRLSATAAGYRDAGAFFGNLSLRWGIRMNTQEPVAAYRRIGGDRLQDWDEQTPSQPDIRLATAWREEPGPLPALQRITSLRDGELLVETGRQASGAARPGSFASWKDGRTGFASTSTRPIRRGSSSCAPSGRTGPSRSTAARRKSYRRTSRSPLWRCRQDTIESNGARRSRASGSPSPVPPCSRPPPCGSGAGAPRRAWTIPIGGPDDASCSRGAGARRARPARLRRPAAASSLASGRQSSETRCGRPRSGSRWSRCGCCAITSGSTPLPGRVQASARARSFSSGFSNAPGSTRSSYARRPGGCNLLARIPGRRREGALLLLNHIDVVAAYPPFWKEAPPFSGEIKNGYLIGRGAYDMKSLAMCQAIALRRLKESGITPETDILFLAEADEEVEEEWGSRWLLEHRPEWFRGVAAVVNEGGTNEVILRQLRFWGVEALQAGYGTLEFEADSEVSLKALAADFPRLDGDVVAPHPQVVESFGMLANHLPYPWAVWLRDLDDVRRDHAKLAKLADRYGSFLEPRIHWVGPYPYPPDQSRTFRSYTAVSVPPGVDPAPFLDRVELGAKNDRFASPSACRAGPRRRRPSRPPSPSS